MIKEAVFMAWSGFSGDFVGRTLNSWEQMGVFSYVLPFLIIFALIVGILSQTKLFDKNKGVNVIISLAVSLMALQFDFVPKFFSEIFPRLGVGLIIILVALIVVGMFFSKNQTRIMFVLGLIVFIVIVIQSLGEFGTSGGQFLEEYWPELLGAGLFIFGLIAIIGAINKKEQQNPVDDNSLLARALGVSK